MVSADIACVNLKHTAPQWCHGPIMRFAILCGSHSGAFVPDLHGSVPESGDNEILATHVSYCDFVWVCLVSLKSLSTSRVY